MLLNDRLQIPFTNKGTTTVKAGSIYFAGDRLTDKRGVLGVAVADVEPGESGLLETSGIFSFEETATRSVRQYQQIYAYYDKSSNNVYFTTTLKDTYSYAGISLTDRVVNGGPLILALGYNNPVVSVPSSPSTSSPSSGGAGAMSDSSTTVDPSNTSEPGAM